MQNNLVIEKFVQLQLPRRTELFDEVYSVVVENDFHLQRRIFRFIVNK